jgi:hypothetical protein
MPELKHSDPPAKTAIRRHLADLKVRAYDSILSLYIARLIRCPFCAVLRVSVLIALVIFVYLYLV